MKPQSIYYMDTLIDLRNGTYISMPSQLAKFKEYPYYNEVHAKDEILKAVQNYTTNK